MVHEFIIVRAAEGVTSERGWERELPGAKPWEVEWRTVKRS